MRRLTLILSDLYLPADAVRESFPATLELPALQWLLRFANATCLGDWRSWLARELGAGLVADWPVAHVRALAAVLPVDGAWLATPVALEARLDHVRLRDRGLLRLPVEQQQALQVEFRQVFGDDMSLQAGGNPSLLLLGGPKADIATFDPARYLDSDIGAALPAASAISGELRRLGAEIEMWLHSSAMNAAREKTGQRRIASLWLWGGGAARPRPPGPVFEQRPLQLLGTDDHVRSLQELVGRELPRPVHAFAAVETDAPAFVEFAPMSGSPTETLPELERNWFAPARAALSAGRLDSLRLIANDQLFEVRARPAWKFWRRRRSWLESLA